MEKLIVTHFVAAQLIAEEIDGRETGIKRMPRRSRETIPD